MNLAGVPGCGVLVCVTFLVLPMMAVLVWQKGELKGVLSAIARAPWTWLLWEYGRLWSLLCALIDGFYLWRIMVCGCDLADHDFSSRSPSDPTFGQKIPGKQLGMTLLILLGIVLIQIPYFGRGLEKALCELVSSF